MNKKQQFKQIKALSHENRYFPWMEIKKRKKGLLTKQIEKEFNLKPSLLSPHLKILLDAGLLSKKEEGHSVRYFALECGFNRQNSTKDKN